MDIRNRDIVLFDLDGTLTNPKLGITRSVQYSLKHFDIHVKDLDTLTPFIGPPLKESFMKFYEFDEQKADEAVEKYREYFSVKGLYDNEVFQGIPKLLSDLKQCQKHILLATSKPAYFAEKILEHFELRQYFSFVSGSLLTGERTDKAEVIRYIIDESPYTDTSRMVMIGDREHDIIGAKKNGIPAIGVLFGFGSLEELEAAGADHIIPDVKALTEFLTNVSE